MDHIRLEPYGARIQLNRLDGENAFSMGEAVVFLAERLARRCSAENQAVIGHIKGFCTTGSGAWIKVSVTDHKRPADWQDGGLTPESRPNGEPLKDNEDRGELILNAHVLGLSAERIDELLGAAVQDLAAEGRVAAEWQRFEDHHHGSEHDHQKHPHCL